MFQDSGGKLFSEQIDYTNSHSDAIDIMETIYLNGAIIRQYTFEDIVRRV